MSTELLVLPAITSPTPHDLLQLRWVACPICGREQHVQVSDRFRPCWICLIERDADPDEIAAGRDLQQTYGYDVATAATLLREMPYERWSALSFDPRFRDHPLQRLANRWLRRRHRVTVRAPYAPGDWRSHPRPGPPRPPELRPRVRKAHELDAYAVASPFSKPTGTSVTFAYYERLDDALVGRPDMEPWTDSAPTTLWWPWDEIPGNEAVEEPA